MVVMLVVVAYGALVKLSACVRLPTKDSSRPDVELIVDAVVFGIVAFSRGLPIIVLFSIGMLIMVAFSVELFECHGNGGSGPSSLNAFGSWILYKKRKPKANSDEPIRSANAVRIGIELLSGLKPHFHSR